MDSLILSRALEYFQESSFRARMTAETRRTRAQMTRHPLRRASLFPRGPRSKLSLNLIRWYAGTGDDREMTYRARKRTELDGAC